MAHIKIAISNLEKQNNGDVNQVWLDLPATDEEFNKAYDEIEICHGDKMYYDDEGNPYEEVIISDYETDINLGITEYYSIDNLNQIAEKIDELSEKDFKIFKAACDAGICDGDSIFDFNSSDYAFYEGVDNEIELAYAYVERKGGDDKLGDALLEKYFNYESYGRDFNDCFLITDWIDIDEYDPDEVEDVCAEYGVERLDEIDAFTFFGVTSESDLAKEMYDMGNVDRDILKQHFDYERFGEYLAQFGDFVEDGFIEAL